VRFAQLAPEAFILQTKQKKARGRESKLPPCKTIAFTGAVVRFAQLAPEAFILQTKVNTKS